jgi:hypothetical protein
MPNDIVESYYKEIIKASARIPPRTERKFYLIMSPMLHAEFCNALVNPFMNRPIKALDKMNTPFAELDVLLDKCCDPMDLKFTIAEKINEP